MQYRVDMFKKFELTQDEMDFINNVHASGGRSMDSHQVHSILANFYLAKQIEASSKSNDKSSNRMFWLTVALGIFAGLQAIQSIPVIIKLITGQ